jgi:hypothetical protein
MGIHKKQDRRANEFGYDFDGLKGKFNLYC